MKTRKKATLPDWTADIANAIAMKTEGGVSNTCWPWLGAISSRGYPVLYIQETKRQWMVQILLWTAYNGPVPAGQCVKQKCDNGSCVNPAHLHVVARGKTTDPAKRLWAKVVKRGDDEHWGWSGAFGSRDRPVFAIRHSQLIFAQTMLWTQLGGAIPEGQCVRAECGDKACMNPRHLGVSPRGIRQNAEQRFWSKVEIGEEHECWVWRAGKLGDATSYGQFWRAELNRSQASHRVSWELAHGAIPDNLFVCHKCDNPPCVNPAHLFLGTYLDNVEDMLRKGRKYFSPGRERPCRLVTEEMVVEVLGRRRRGETVASIARTVETSQATVYRIMRGDYFPHLLEQKDDEDETD
jgi:hypothetical protein